MAGRGGMKYFVALGSRVRPRGDAENCTKSEVDSCDQLVTSIVLMAISLFIFNAVVT